MVFVDSQKDGSMLIRGAVTDSDVQQAIAENEKRIADGLPLASRIRFSGSYLVEPGAGGVTFGVSGDSGRTVIMEPDWPYRTAVYACAIIAEMGGLEMPWEEKVAVMARWGHTDIG